MLDQAVDLLVDLQIALLLFEECVAHAALGSSDSLQERFHVLALVMTRIFKLLLDYLHGVETVELGLDDLDLLPRVPSQLLQLLVVLAEHGVRDALLSLAARGGSRGLLTLLGVLDPVEEGLLDEDLTGVEDQAPPTP